MDVNVILGKNLNVERWRCGYIYRQIDIINVTIAMLYQYNTIADENYG